MYRMNIHKKFLRLIFLVSALAAFAYGEQKVAVRLSVHGDILSAAWLNNGLPVNVLINAEPGCEIQKADFAITSKGKTVIVWSEKSIRKDESDLFAQMFTLSGKHVWKNEKSPVNVFRGNQCSPKIAPALDGGFFVVWQSDSAGKNNINIWCQRFSQDGKAAWSTPVPVCAFSGNQINPVITTDIDGSLLVAWEDYRRGNADIYGQRIEQDGSFTGPEDGAVIDESIGNQTDVRFKLDAQGQPTALKWNSKRSGFLKPVVVETDISKMPIPEPGIFFLLFPGLLFLLVRFTNR